MNQYRTAEDEDSEPREIEADAESRSAPLEVPATESNVPEAVAVIDADCEASNRTTIDTAYTTVKMPKIEKFWETPRVC